MEDDFFISPTFQQIIFFALCIFVLYISTIQIIGRFLKRKTCTSEKGKKFFFYLLSEIALTFCFISAYSIPVLVFGFTLFTINEFIFSIKFTHETFSEPLSGKMMYYWLLPPLLAHLSFKFVSLVSLRDYYKYVADIRDNYNKCRPQKTN